MRWRDRRVWDMSEKERVNRVRTCTDATFQHMEMVERLSAREETMEHAAM